MRCWNLGLKAPALVAALSLLAACSSTPETATMSDSGGQTTPAPIAAQAPQSPGPSAPVDMATQEYLDLNIGSLIYFDFDRYDLKPDARATVERWAEWLRQNPDVSVTIEGHCDERGTREYNLGLGERRATAARNYLIALGIGGSRVATISYGKERPACTASNEACWSQNRRDHMVVN